MKSLLLTALVFTFHLINAQPPGKKGILLDKSAKKAAEQASSYVDSLRAKQDIPGISVCVGNREKVLWAQGFGFADLENKVLVTIESKFRMGSVSKSITSLAVGRLVQEEKLDLDAPVQRYVSGFPEKKHPVTSRQLASHQAGIRHYRDNDPLACPQRYKSVNDGLAIFKDDTLLFKPGTAYGYSTYGYTLLSAVIEGASGQEYLAFLEKNVFRPLGMLHTGADYSDSVVTGRVRFYEHDSKGRLVNAAMVDNSYKWAGGGLLSTPQDLVTMGRGLLNRSLLQEKTVNLLFTPQPIADGTNTGYGLGWRIGTDSKGRKIIHHGGTIDGGRTFLMLYPDEGLIVAITANMSGVNINIQEAETLAAYFLNR